MFKTCEDAALRDVASGNGGVGLMVGRDDFRGLFPTLMIVCMLSNPHCPDPWKLYVPDAAGLGPEEALPSLACSDALLPPARIFQKCFQKCRCLQMSVGSCLLQATLLFNPAALQQP